MPNIGPLEIIIVLVIVLVIFGPKRLPDLGRSLGSGMREFKDSVTGDKDDDKHIEASDSRSPSPCAGREVRGHARRRSELLELADRIPAEGGRGLRCRAYRPIDHEDRLTLVDHLDELRTRIIIACRAPGRGRVGLCFWQNHLILEIVNEPLPDNLPEPITFGVTEPFTTTLTNSAYFGLLISLPVILYQVYAFVLPAFSPQERRVAMPLLLMVPFLFIAGVAVLLLRGPRPGHGLPPQLQRGRVQHPGPGARLLQLRHAHDGAPWAWASRCRWPSSRRAGWGSPRPRSCARTAATRSS